MSDHTPGPWRIEEGECSDSGTRWSEWAVTSAAGPICAEIFLEPNARLIAAAPDLLKACRSVWASGGLPGANLTNALDRVRAAIDKAEGRKS